MPKIRVLAVDDSVVVRRLLTEALSADPAIEVVATAPNGRIALAKIPQSNPDLITLDVDMPELDGLKTLAELRKSYRNLPVIMFSALTEENAAATLDALALGANDYVAKPSGTLGVQAALERIQKELAPRIKALCRSVPPPSRPTATSIGPAERPAIKPPPLEHQRASIDLVVIGVSTGGPNALAELLPEIAPNFPAPILIVQHMPPIFTRHLADRLAARSAIRVREAAAPEILQADGAWIAPGNFHMIVKRDGPNVRIGLTSDPPENSCRPSVDVLFRSAAEVYGPRTLAVVLTGMGQDGLRGCELISSAGGRILVQDAATSVVWGMPGAVAKAGLADKVLPLNQIAAELNRLAFIFRPKSQSTVPTSFPLTL